MTVVQQIGQELSATDRAAFATYVAVHGRWGRNCGYNRGRDGKPPETVGEAIAMMTVGTA